jgi:hypothetical protein
VPYRLKFKIIVISDTHCGSLDELPKPLTEELEGADMVIHAGDYTGLRLLEQLSRLPGFRGVYGNIDGEDVRRRLRPVERLEVEGVTIGVTHPASGGPPFGIRGRVREILGNVNVAIYGHTHRPYVGEEMGTLYVNPGSATGHFPALSRTYAILRLKEKPEAEIVKI